MKKMKVAQKLILGFGIVISLSIVFAVIAIWSARTIDYNFTHLFEYPQQRYDALLKANNKISEIKYSVANMSIFAGFEGTEDSINRQLEVINQLLKQFNAEIDCYIDLVETDTEYTAIEKNTRINAANDIKSLSKRWYDEVIVPIKKANIEGNREEVIRLSIPLSAIASELYSSVGNLVIKTQEFVLTKRANTVVASDRTVIILIFLSFAIIFVSIGFAVFISANIIKPLTDLTVMLKNNNLTLEGEVDAKTHTVFQLQVTVLRAVADLVECRDKVTGGHIERIQHYLKMLLDFLMESGVYSREISLWDIDLFIMSSQLHDVGKISIRDEILLKPGPLTEEEFEEMKKHAEYGVQIVRRISGNKMENDFLQYAEILVGSHHEKWDGTGYPLGLAGEEIPLQGRLMAIIDVYDALTNDRPYKEAFSHENALDIIKSGSGSHFDPLICGVFLRHENAFKTTQLATENEELLMDNETSDQDALPKE